MAKHRSEPMFEGRTEQVTVPQLLAAQPVQGMPRSVRKLVTAERRKVVVPPPPPAAAS